MAEFPLIIAAHRTPRGVAKPSGALHALRPAELLAGHLKAVAGKLPVQSLEISDAIFGCVTQTGEQGGNIGKVATLLAGWSPHLSAITVNRYCASGLSAVQFAAQQALASNSVAVGGGIEMMSRTPMMSDQAPHYSDKELSETIGFMPPPWTSDLIATRHGFSRARCDEYAALSQQRAVEARANAPMPSMLPVTGKDGTILLARDETPREGTTASKLGGLKTVYEDGNCALDAWGLAREPQLKEIRHVHTAGNAPCMADGAAAVVLASRAAAARHGLTPRARILSQADACVPIFQTGAVDASRLALKRAGLRPDQIELWEVRDSFAAITLHYIEAMQVPLDRFNVNGSSIALGHPMGATGAMLVSCLLDEMDRRELRYGLVAIAGAAGVANAAVIERLPTH